jgi:prepilin-type N-terminal cleavage/methylation domain-containing protein
MPNKIQKGFTLIELLIVIAVLGILAVAVLSAINPIEQINRSRDTGSKSDSEQLISAIDRFYASSGYYPWAADADSDNTELDPLVEIDTADQTFGTDAEEMLTRLSDAESGELKSSYIQRIVGGANKLSIYNLGTQGSSTYVCFVPKSASMRTEAWNRCEETSANLPTDFPADACPATACTDAAAASAATACYICLP